ncbi:Protease HtpX [Acaryochloris thomasi RCC1774]|uniref:Protease HtpX homolog n=1 Tax=Acaryochloris thomasi RCC1774 TaxID=1764569 RepID=A0A2W1JAT8_9CYAN|nr:M48 family metalloprotease [Acaryochloris thomasi]PZD71223.1 Protease HtpX [Acaryochloris thomasi RCC1774]
MLRLNQIKTAGLLGLLSGLIVLASYYLVGNEQGLYLGLAFSAVTSIGSWFYSDKAALAAFQAQPLERSDNPRYFDMVAKLCDRADLPMPKLYIIPTKSPNAFATGRNPENAAVAATQGIIDLLSTQELEGVIAHELTHIRNRDTLTQAVAGTLAGAITFLGRILTFGGLYLPASRDNRRGGNPLALLFLIVLAPLSAMLIQLGISRTREFSADEGAAQITGRPLALASALQKLETIGQQIPINGNPSMSPLLIINPLSKEGLQTLFRTHPTTEARIQRLQELANQTSGTKGLVSSLFGKAS